MDGGLLLGDTALDIALGVGLDMLLHHHDALNEDAILVGDDTEDAALLTLVLTGDYFHFVIPLYLDACHISLFSSTICTAAEPDSGKFRYST
jgi:hypothetical protein